MKRMILSIVACTVITASAPTLFASGPGETPIILSGIAKGGFLQYVTGFSGLKIETHPGMTAAEVIDQLIAASKSPNWSGPPMREEEGKLWIMSLPDGSAGFAGTEAGLNIPAPPVFLSGWYDKAADSFQIQWQNQGDYAMVALKALPSTMRGRSSFNVLGETEVAGLSRRFRVEADTDVRVAVYVAAMNVTVPSAPCHMRISMWSQKDEFWFPFYLGVAPNWLPLSQSGTASVRLSEGKKDPEFDPNKFAFREVVRRGVYYQRLATDKADSAGGTYRRFFGLHPEHRYRISTKLNTMKANEEHGFWRLAALVGGGDFDALCEDPSALYEAVRGGKDTLDAIGLSTVASVGSDDGTTGGRWKSFATTDGNGASEGFLMPEGESTLSVFVVLVADTPVDVGFEGLTVEDLTCQAQLSSNGGGQK
jgi:hypothetical protein